MLACLYLYRLPELLVNIGIQKNWVSHLFVKCLVFSIVNKLNIPICCELWPGFRYAGEALREEPFFKVAFWKRRIYKLVLTEGIHPGWRLPHPGGKRPARLSLWNWRTGHFVYLFQILTTMNNSLFMIRCHLNDDILIHNTFVNYTRAHVYYGVNGLLGPSIPW